MAEGTTYEIEVQAKDTGADATEAQVLGLADAIEAAERVLTPFDSALEAASAQLDAAGAAADVATQGLAEAEAEYKRLERAATSAAKKVERAQAKGKDTGALRASATAAAAAVTKQAAAVDRAAAKANKAAAAQKKLAAAYKTVERRAARAAEETRGTQRSFGDLFGAAGALGGPLGGLAGQISGVGDGLRAGGKMGGLITLAFGAGNAMIMMTKASIGLAVGLGAVVTGLLAFAVAADKATTKKLGEAWEKAQKSAKGLFEGVNTSKLVKPVESLLKLLDKNTSAGKGLAHIFETLLNPIIDGLVDAGPLAEEFTKGLIIGALKAIIFVKKLRNAIVRAVPKSAREKIKQLVASIFSLENAASSGETAFKVLGLVLTGLLIPVVLLGVFFAMVGVVLVNMVTTAESAVKILSKVGEAIEEATDPANVERNAQKMVQSVAELVGAIFNALGKLGGKAGQIGQDVWKGIVRGMVSGKGPVKGAAEALAAEILGGLAGGLESKSPSRAAERVTATVPEGAVVALGKGTPVVEAAAEEMGTSMIAGLGRGAKEEAPPARGPAKGDGASQGRTVHLHLEENSIVINGAKDDREMAARLKEMLISLMEGEGLQMGAGETVAA
jgi:hypothetical protein